MLEEHHRARHREVGEVLPSSMKKICWWTVAVAIQYLNKDRIANGGRYTHQMLEPESIKRIVVPGLAKPSSGASQLLFVVTVV